MPRKTPTEDLQDGDTHTGSPLLRRSTRIAQSAPASPVVISKRRNSADVDTPRKITKTKRLSLTQESSNDSESVRTPKKTRSLRSASKSPSSLAKESDCGGTPSNDQSTRGSITRLIEDSYQSSRAASPIQKTGSRSSRSNSLSSTSVKEHDQGAIPKTHRDSNSEKIARLQPIEEIETEHPKKKITRYRGLSPILDTIEENTCKAQLVENEPQDKLQSTATNVVEDSSTTKSSEIAKETTLKPIQEKSDSNHVDESNTDCKLTANYIPLSHKKEEIICIDENNVPIANMKKRRMSSNEYEDSSSSKTNEVTKEHIALKSLIPKNDSDAPVESNKEDKSIAENVQPMSTISTDDNEDSSNKESEIVNENIMVKSLPQKGDSKEDANKSNKEGNLIAADVQHLDKKSDSNEELFDSNEDISEKNYPSSKLHVAINSDIIPIKEQVNLDVENVSSSSKQPEIKSPKSLKEELPICTGSRNRLSLKKGEKNETKPTSLKQSQEQSLRNLTPNEGDMTIGSDGSFELHLSLRSNSQEDVDLELEVSKEGVSTENVLTTNKCSNKEISERSEEQSSFEKQKVASLDSDKFKKSPKVFIERFNMETNLSLQNVSVEVERIDLEKIGNKDCQTTSINDSEKDLKVPIKPTDDYFEESVQLEHTDNTLLQQQTSSYENQNVLPLKTNSAGVNTLTNSKNVNNETKDIEEKENILMGKEKSKCVDQKSEDNVNEEQGNIAGNSINQIQEQNLEHNNIKDMPNFEINEPPSVKISNEKTVEKSTNMDKMSTENGNERSNSVCDDDEKVKEVKCPEHTDNVNDTYENVSLEISEDFGKDGGECEINIVVKECSNNETSKEVEEFPNTVSSCVDQIVDCDKFDNNQMEINRTGLTEYSENVKSNEAFNKIYPEEKIEQTGNNEKITKDVKDLKTLSNDELEHVADVESAKMQELTEVQLVDNAYEKEKINIEENEEICNDGRVAEKRKDLIKGNLEPLTCEPENQRHMSMSEEQVIENTDVQMSTESINEITHTEVATNKTRKNNNDDIGLNKHESFCESTPAVENAIIQHNADSNAKIKDQSMLFEAKRDNESYNEEQNVHDQGPLQSARVDVKNDTQTDYVENIEQKENEGMNIGGTINQEYDLNLDVNIEQEPACTLDSQSIASLADISQSSSGDDKCATDFIDDMCEEGEEDTPSDGSNDIICEGESLHSDGTEEDTDDDYEQDSFIDDDEVVELLSGEDDLMQETQVSSKRITGKKYSRIIEVSDSENEFHENNENEETSLVFSEVEDDPKRQICDQLSKAESIESKQCESDDNEMSIPYLGQTPSSHMSDKEVNNRGVKLTASKTNILTDAENNLKNYEEEESNTPIVFENVEEVSNSANVINVDSEDNECTNRNVVGESDTRTQNSSMFDPDTSILKKGSKHKSYINIQENIKLEDIKDGVLSERITKVVDWFYSSIKNTKDVSGNILLNVSLDYVNAKPNDEIPESKIENETLQLVQTSSTEDLLGTTSKKRLSCISSEEPSFKKLRQDSSVTSPMKRHLGNKEFLDQSTQLVDVQLIQTTTHDDSNEELDIIATSDNLTSDKGIGNRETKRRLKKKHVIKSNSNDSVLEKYSIANETLSDSKVSKKNRKKTACESDDQADVDLRFLDNDVSGETNRQIMKKHKRTWAIEGVGASNLFPDSHDLTDAHIRYTDLSKKRKKESSDTKDEETNKDKQVQSKFRPYITSKSKQNRHKKVLGCHDHGGSSDYLEHLGFEEKNDNEGTTAKLSKKRMNKVSASTTYTHANLENKDLEKSKKLRTHGGKSNLPCFSITPFEQLPNKESVTKQGVYEMRATNKCTKNKRNLLAPSKVNADGNWEAESFDVDISLPCTKNTKKRSRFSELNKNKSDAWIESFANCDFKNKMLYDPNRIKRVDTKMLLRTKHTHV